MQHSKSIRFLQAHIPERRIEKRGIGDDRGRTVSSTSGNLTPLAKAALERAYLSNCSFCVDSDNAGSP